MCICLRHSLSRIVFLFLGHKFGLGSQNRLILAQHLSTFPCHMPNKVLPRCLWSMSLNRTLPILT